MLPDLKLVVRLQDLDKRVSKLTREISSLPKHISEIEKKLTGQERKLEADRAALSANQKDRKRMESEIQSQEQKISKLKDQMLEAKTNDQYRAFQTEIEFCEKEIHRCEDRTLELMSESEPLEKAVKAAEEAMKAEKARVEAEKQEARARTAADKKASDALMAERKEIVAALSPAVYRKYETVRRGRRGIAVAEATEGLCTACNMTMRLQFFQDLRRGDEIMTCESCGRILYYNPPVLVEDPGGTAAPVPDAPAAPASNHEPRGITLAGLVRARLIETPADLRVTFGERTFTATLDTDGTIVAQGQKFHTPSTALGAYRSLVEESVTEGWQYFDKDTGRWEPLERLQARYEQR